MTSTTSAPEMSSAQKTKVAECKEKFGDRFVRYNLIGDRLKIYYRTKGGYYVEVIYNEAAEILYTNYYQFWNETQYEPFGFLFRKM
jgi:sugar-specific transcriptional regulator TrmB